jgi:rfaE bifunctional protein kinase chain/domain
MLEKARCAKGRDFTRLTESRLQWILDRITRTRILVLGDYCLDIYWFVDSSRSEKSLETGLMTNPVREQRYSLGGAGNVVNNLVAAGCREVRALGVIGDDPWGHEMIRLLQQIRVKTEDVLVQKERWATLAYNKPHIHEMESNRFDFGNFNELSSQTARALLERCRVRIPEADAIIVNQQVRQGIHTQTFRESVVGLIREFPEKIFIVDSRHFSESYSGAFMKINDQEATRLCGTVRASEAEVVREQALLAAGELFARFRKPVFVTRGSRGIIVTDDRGLCEIPGIQVIGRVDTVGAGDSALAGIGLALATGSDTVEAAQLGNFVAGVTIRKLNQTGTASPGEILAISREQASGLHLGQ